MNATKLLTLAALSCSLMTPALAKIPISADLPGSAKPGDSVKVCVRTEAKARCKIEAQDAGFSQGLNLLDKTANKSGKAFWKFDIPKNFKADKMPVIITVDKNGQEDKLVRSIDILK